MTGKPVQLLIVGTPGSCGLAAQTLEREPTLAGLQTLTRFQPADALALLTERRDIDLVLLVNDGGHTNDLPALAASFAGDDRCLAPLMVRSRTPLPQPIRDALWELDTVDRLYGQPIDSPDLADSVMAALRDQRRIGALVAIADASERLEHARTLWELADLMFAILREHGIGEPGVLLCLLGGSSEPRMMGVAGSGRHAGIGCIPLEACGDAGIVAAVREATGRQNSVFADDRAVLYLHTSGNDVACLYLSLDTPLSAWQKKTLRVLSRAFSIAIGKNQAAQRLQRTQHATITTMATLAEYRDVDTGEHVARVARHATEIAQVLADRGLVADPEMVREIGLAAILHDIGKIAIPEPILLKPGPLDAEERRVMETHSQLGHAILTQAANRSDNAELLRRAAEIAFYHHERFDGSGYPSGIAGEDIPLAARIVALVDVYDALTSIRPYKDPWPYHKAVGVIVAGAGSHFDPVVVDAFLSLEGTRRSADFFVWNDSMSVGRRELDADHKRLIGIINRLWVAESGGNRQVIEFVLDDLLHYTESHFKREEEIMAEGGYPDFERHRGIHRAICRRLEEIRWEYFQGIREELRGEILEFLKDWLHRHILVEDMGYRPWLSPTP